MKTNYMSQECVFAHHVSTRWISTLLFAFAILFGVIGTTACDSGPSKEAKQIENVLEQDSKTQLNLPENEREAIQVIVIRMRAIDTSGCPGEFRAVYERHIHAWEGMRDQVLSEPDGFLEGALVGLLNGLAGDFTGGTADIAQARNYWSAQIRDTWNEVRALAMQYGADIR